MNQLDLPPLPNSEENHWFTQPLSLPGLETVDVLRPAREPYQNTNAPALVLVLGLSMDARGYVRQLQLAPYVDIHTLQANNNAVEGEKDFGHFARHVEEYIIANKLEERPGGFVLGGTVIGTCMAHHRHQEWLKFLRKIDGEILPGKQVHLIVDNYATHKHPKVLAWLKRHSRFHLHFTPTSSSWLNLVERWFRELTDKRIRRGSFRSVREVIDAVMEFVDNHNQDAKPYLWTAQAQNIIAKYRRAKAALEKLKQDGTLH